MSVMNQEGVEVVQGVKIISVTGLMKCSLDIPLWSYITANYNGYVGSMCVSVRNLLESHLD
jgi:hypothetical protein